MSAKQAAALAEALASYDAVLAAVPGVERKGATMPYTSVNGNMHSFLDKAGVTALRLGDKHRAAFVVQFGAADYVHETGTVLREYVSLPPDLMANTKAAAKWFARSLVYAETLKPKPTTRKKKAA